jgi:hypothetical protein
MAKPLCDRKGSYCVWWVHGFLRANNQEVPVWKAWGQMFQRVFYEEKLATGFDPPYHLHWKEKCTALEFIEICQWGLTAAIFWVSHGKNGYPVGYHPDFAKRDPTAKEAADNDIRPFQMEVSANLRALVLIACESSFYTADWDKALPDAAVVKTFRGIVQDSAKPNSDVSQWLQRSAFYSDPKLCARNMLRHVAKKSWKVQPSRGGCSGSPLSSSSVAPSGNKERVAAQRLSGRLV